VGREVGRGDLGRQRLDALFALERGEVVAREDGEVGGRLGVGQPRGDAARARETAVVGPREGLGNLGGAKHVSC
jgi:hypothetical protein